MAWWQFIKRREKIYGLNTFRLAALLVLVVFLMLSILLSANAARQVRRDSRQAFNTKVDSIQRIIDNNIQTYEEIMRGGVGLFNSSTSVTLPEWQNFVRNFRIDERHKGLRSVSFARHLTAAETDAFTAEQQATGNPYFSLKSPGPGPEYVPITYVEPLTETSVPFLGTDLLSLQDRSDALLMARDSGQPTMSHMFTLLVDQGKVDKPNGFSIYMPVYRQGTPTNTVEERRAAIYGYVFATFVTQTLLDNIVGQESVDNFAFQFADAGDHESSDIVYQTANYEAVDQKDSLERETQLVVDNHTWKTRYIATYEPFTDMSERQRALNVILFGSIFSVMLSGFLYMLMVSRARRITQSKQHEVQQAKDELLSLASHQLRTPATGVKQYVGMVLQGYTGDITAQQRAMLQKAFQSNERQLETINQILYVTKADAGRIKLRKQKIDINETIEDIIAEQAETIRERGQEIRFRPKRRRMSVLADLQYLRMAIENLISNASKYSHEGSVIQVGSEKSEGMVVITVKDSGVGIAADDLPKLFHKFSRIDNELSVKAGGSGIGLYLTREIVELHGGTISVESRPGKGSMFTMTLPAKKRLR